MWRLYVKIKSGFPGIASCSNVRLDSFYWRDTLPAQVQLDTMVTGTYNITYRVNGGEPRAQADSLSTSQNYTLAAKRVPLGNAAGQIGNFHRISAFLLNVGIKTSWINEFHNHHPFGRYALTALISLLMEYGLTLNQALEESR